MGDPQQDRPNEAAPVSVQQLREALGFITEQYNNVVEGGKNVFVWLWEALQGDFNQQRSTGQVVFDTVVSMIPGVDQVCDVRDIIANCKQIDENKSNAWAWVGLVLTLIGLFPTLGSLVKGVLKIFFLFVRRFGLNHVTRAVDEAMSWVITLLRRREVAQYWKHLRWDRVFHELARQVRIVRDLVTSANLLKAFDRGILLMRNLLGKVEDIPFIGASAKTTMELVGRIRQEVNSYIGAALRPVHEIMETIIRRLEIEDILQRGGILDARNVHFTGTLPEAHAVTLMQRMNPQPAWLSKGTPSQYTPLRPAKVRQSIQSATNEGYPALSNPQIKSFARGMNSVVLEGPLKLYRVVSPSNTGAGSDWMTEDVFRAIARSAMPRNDWRKKLAVWPDWNPNGQFVVYEIKAGEKLKVWKGPASAQIKENGSLPDHFLEGGYEQVKFDASIPYRADGSFPVGANGKPLNTHADTMRFYDVNQATGVMTPNSTMTYAAWKALPASDQLKYISIREAMNNPRISGPYDTGWGTLDFSSQLANVKLGLPNIPGQITKQ